MLKKILTQFFLIANCFSLSYGRSKARHNAVRHSSFKFSLVLLLQVILNEKTRGLGVAVMLPGELSSRGLLGTPNGNPEDDIAKRDGIVLTPGNMADYHDFGLDCKWNKTLVRNGCW